MLAKRGISSEISSLVIIPTRPSPPMLGFADKVLARNNCAIFNSHITEKTCYVCTTTSKARASLGNYNFPLSSPLRVGLVEIIV